MLILRAIKTPTRNWCNRWQHEKENLCSWSAASLQWENVVFYSERLARFLFMFLSFLKTVSDGARRRLIERWWPIACLQTHSHRNRRFILDFGLNRLAIREGEEKFLDNQTGFRWAACGVPRKRLEVPSNFSLKGKLIKSWTLSKWRTFKEIKNRKPMTLHGRVLEDSKPKTVHSCTERKQRNEMFGLVGLHRSSYFPEKRCCSLLSRGFFAHICDARTEIRQTKAREVCKNCYAERRIYCLSSKMQNASMSAGWDEIRRSTRSRLFADRFECDLKTLETVSDLFVRESLIQAEIRSRWTRSLNKRIANAGFTVLLKFMIGAP